MKYRFVWVNDFNAVIRAVCFDDKSIYNNAELPSEQLERYILSITMTILNNDRVYKIEMPDGVLVGFFVMHVTDAGVYSEGHKNIRSQFREADIVAEIQTQINKFVAEMLPALKTLK